MHKLAPEKREVFNASAQSPSKISASNNTAKLAIKKKNKKTKKSLLRCITSLMGNAQRHKGGQARIAPSAWPVPDKDGCTHIQEATARRFANG